MFDQLTESNTNKNEAKGRRGYFVVTALLVGALFMTGVVWSLYGKDLVLGGGDLELSMLVAPVELPENAPKPPKPREPEPERRATASTPSAGPPKPATRQANILRIEETPKTPAAISTAPSASKERTSNFVISPGLETGGNTSSSVAVGPGTGGGPGTGTGTGPGDGNDTVAANKPPVVKDPPPPVKADPPAPKKDIVLSKGVINGKATDLPKPVYTAAAIALRLTGVVNVQVMIDEKGHVISAKAVSGPALLRQSAEQAARQAKFSPTLLSDQAVKVSGVISYNFNRS